MTGPGTIRPSQGQETARGAVVEQTYLRRTVYVYPLYESEVRHLKSDNDRASTYFSVAGALIAFAVGILTNAMFAADWAALPAEAKVAIKLVTPLLTLGGLMMLFLGLRARKAVSDTLDTFKFPAEAETSI